MKKISFLWFAIVFSFMHIAAQKTEIAQNGFYVGLQGGIPFGVSTFSSFGEEKTHLGWDASIFAGYQFNPTLSTDIFGLYGKTDMSVRSCCNSYWLGSDGVRYYSAIPDFQGWNYKDLKSRASFMQYGARLNINILGLFQSLQQSRWNITLSPSISAIGTKTELQNTIDGNTVFKDEQKWHLGYGGDISVGYKLSSRLTASIFSGITMVTGSRIDALPKWCHNANYIWNSGIRIAWNFCSSKKVVVPHAEEEVIEITALQPEPAKSEPQVEEKPIEKQETEKPAPIVKEEPKVIPNVFTFPTVYFPFNSHRIVASQTDSMKQILQVMKTNRDIKVKITGWCDSRGSKAVNEKISRQRANAVKQWLVNNGITRDRISTVGAGINYSATSHWEARHAATIELK